MNEEYSSFERELDESGRLVYTNVGVSMMPLIRENRDVMVIEKTTSAPKKLQAVLYRRNGVEGRGKYVVHRIVRENKDGTYFIVGDNCTEGETVEKADILGVLTALMRGGKQVDFDSLRYKAYLYLWCAPYRARFLILRIKRGLNELFSAVKHKLSGK